MCLRVSKKLSSLQLQSMLKFNPLDLGGFMFILGGKKTEAL